MIVKGMYWWQYGSYLPRRPRWLNWLWTRIAGLFWLPCPKCTHNFGGHEVGPRTFDFPGETLGTYQLVCYRHADDRQENQQGR